MSQGAIQFSGGQLNLQGATLGGGTIAAGTNLVGESGVLDGVTVSGTFTVSGGSGVAIVDGITVNGTATLGGSPGYGYLNFQGNQTLAGTGWSHSAARTHGMPWWYRAQEQP